MENDDERLPPEVRAAWGAMEPPAGFAERVAAAWQQEQSARAQPPRRRGLSLVVGALTLAAAALLMVLMHPPSARGRGERVAHHTVEARTTLDVGGRATAVAEPGSDVAWRVAASGAARVEQRAGDIFYRVEKGGPFVVTTPAGDVTVQGTCFRVEVEPMKVGKQSLVAASVGALAATTVLVTVYEGRVLLANERGQTTLAAGDRGRATAGSAPARLDGPAAHAAAVTVAPPLPPAPDATREELLARDAAQRQELAQLRARVHQLEVAGAGDGAGGARKGDSFFAPSKAELEQMAKQCKLQWDLPPLAMPVRPMDPDRAQQLGLSDEERRDIDRVHADFNQKMLAQLRALYVEVTGDKAGADALSPQSLVQEIQQKSPEAAAQQAYWRLSHERAGLLAPPADTSSAPPIERLMRLLTTGGDEYEHELGAVIGPDRARSLREERGSWGSRSSSSYGCPDGQ